MRLDVSFKVAGAVCFALLLTPPEAGATSTLALPEFSTKPKYCLFFTVDGLDRDYISTETMPNVYSWMKAGVELPDAINVYPTLTTPNMTSIMTGAYPASTGIGGNQVFLKEEKKVVAAPRFNKAVTIGEVFQSAGYKTAAVQHFMLENRGADRYQHTGTKISHDVTTTALAMLADKEQIPTLMVVLYQTVDGTGHAFGQQSAEARAEARLVDGEMCKVLNRYRELGILQDTLVVVSADHGMSHTEKTVDMKSLNDVVTSGGWTYQLLTSPKQKPADNVDLHVLPYTNLQCYFNRPFPPEEQERLFDALSSVEGVGRIYDSIALRRMGAHPNGGDFVVEMATGWWLAGKGGTHGRNRESDGHQSLMGAGILAGKVIRGAETVDLVPTVLKAFGLEIPKTVDGKPLDDALRK